MREVIAQNFFNHADFYLGHDFLFLARTIFSAELNPEILSPDITLAQYCGGCSVHWRFFSGITSVLWRLFSTVGDNISTVEGIQYCGGIASVLWSDSFSTVGG